MPKEKDDINPFLGGWEVKSIYTTYTDPVAGLKDEIIDVKTFLLKNGYYPSLYKRLLFYDADNTALIISETFKVPDEDGYLYSDQITPRKESKTTDRIMEAYFCLSDAIFFVICGFLKYIIF